MLSKRKARSLKYGDVVGGWEGLIFEEMSRGREQLTVVVIFIKLPVHRRSLIAKRWTVVIHVVVVVASLLNQSTDFNRNLLAWFTVTRRKIDIWYTLTGTWTVYGITRKNIKEINQNFDGCKENIRKEKKMKWPPLKWNFKELLQQIHGGVRHGGF